MNLDEMLKASGISGGAASGNDNVKSGFVTFIGRPNRYNWKQWLWQVYTYE